MFRQPKPCPKCEGLFFGPFKGRRPAGGVHSADRSFNYGVQSHARPINPSLHLVDDVEVSEIQVVGNGFTLSSRVNIDFGFETAGLDGVHFTTRGDLVASTDVRGHFGGMTFAIPSNAFNIGARAVDVATGQAAVAPVIREEV